ncbi:MAG: carboxypeptidase regulatory-like domain-containing protein [Myxococcales bacterium]|nr:carboxypeptidase regulatory-like domain-containing protein [Myxococcales bacterium]
MRIAPLAVVLAFAAVGCGTAPHPRGGGRPSTGTIAGLARDHDSGDPVALADIRLRGKDVDNMRALSTDKGTYSLAHLKPGRYQLTASFAGQPVEVTNIDVKAGETTHVDLVFTLGHPDPIRVDYGDPKQSQIDHYNPTNLGTHVSIIEGTVNDLATHERVPGAVVTAVLHGTGTGPQNEQTEQTISDDDGHYRFEPVAPGTYAVSAYYSIGGRGQIEVRRSGIAVGGAQAVIVPLWIELVR